MATRLTIFFFLGWHAALVLSRIERTHVALDADYTTNATTYHRHLAGVSTLGCMQDGEGKSLTWGAARKVESYAGSLLTNNNYYLGRQSCYEGPIGHLGFCGKPLYGNPVINAAGVAIGRKFLDHNGVGPGNCGRCMCVRILSADLNCNKYAPMNLVSPVKGKQFKAQVMDQCPECPDNHIDILLDGIYADSDDVSGINPKWSDAKRRWSGKPGYPVIQGKAAKTVGVWLVEWTWAADVGDGCNLDCDDVFEQKDLPTAQQQAAGKRPTRKSLPKAAPLRKSPPKQQGHKTSPPKSGNTAPKMSPPKSAGSCVMVKPKWQQCGGTKINQWLSPKGEKGGDRPWKNVCCAKGLKCVRKNKPLWQCE